MASKFLLQTYALTLKNLRLLVRLRKLSLCEFLCPLILMILCAVLNSALTYTGVRLDESRELFTFADAATVPIPCRVFDNVDGRYGEGMPIPYAWCVPLAFAPYSGAALSVMTELAGRNGFAAPALFSGNVSREEDIPAACAPSTADGAPSDGGANAIEPGCLLGFATVAELRMWLLHHRGRAGLAVVFGGSPSSAAAYDDPTSPWADPSAEPLSTGGALTYEVWYNQSAVGFYAAAGLDPLREGLSAAELGYPQVPPSNLLAVQRMVDEALLAWAGSQHGKLASDASIGFEARTLPRLRAHESGGFSAYISIFVALCLLVSHVVMVYRITSERERGIVSAMRAMGLLDTAYWLSYWALAIVGSVITSTIVYISGKVASLTTTGFTLFESVDGGALWTIMTLFSLAMASQSFVLASIISRTRTGIMFAVFGLFGTIELIGLTASAPQMAYIIYEKPFMTPLRTVLEMALPGISYMKLSADIAGAIEPTRVLNETTNEYSIIPAPTLTFNQYGATSLSNYSQNLTAMLYSDDLDMPKHLCCLTWAGIYGLAAYFAYTLRTGPIVMQIGMQALFCVGVAGCCFRCRNASDARSQPICFPLNPRYWIPSLNRRRTAALHASPRHRAMLQRLLKKAEGNSSIDSDVLDETRKVCTTDTATWQAQAATAGVAATGGSPPTTQVVILGLRKFFMKEATGSGDGCCGNGCCKCCNKCCNVKTVNYAVDGVCLTMQTDATFALLGHNGAGKTTLINMATAQLKPSEGDALVCGASVNCDAGTVRKAYGCCPQHDILYPELSAHEHLSLFGMLKGRGHSVLSELIPGLMEKLALKKVMHKPAGQYSGGMKRRLSFAVACIGEPKVLMLDEPTTGMDPMNRRFVWDHVHFVKAGRTVLLTTHSMEEADALGDRIGIMSKGQLVALGTSLRLKDKFGEGYRLQLVAPRDSVAPIRAKVAELQPAAEVLGDDSGNLIYTLAPSDAHAAPELFRYAENVEAGGVKDVRLTGWGVSHTTLEDVFLKLAKSDENPDKKVMPPKSTGGGGGCCGKKRTKPNADGTEMTSASPAAYTEAQAAEALEQRHGSAYQLRALIKRTALLQSRQRFQCFCGALFCPVIFLILIILMQYFLLTAPRQAAEYNEKLRHAYQLYGCGNVTSIMHQACEARGDVRDFGTSHYPVGAIKGYPGCTFCEENERSWQCRKYPENAWAWEIDDDAIPANPGYWFRYEASSHCRVPDFGRDHRGQFYTPPFANCTDASFEASHGWCNCSSTAFDELVERTDVCRQLKQRISTDEYYNGENTIDRPSTPLVQNFDHHIAPDGSLKVGSTCSLGSVFCTNDAQSLIGLRIAVSGPADELGSVSVEGDAEGVFLGSYDEHLYTAPGGNESALAASLAARVSVSGLLKYFPLGVAHEDPPKASGTWTDVEGMDSTPLDAWRGVAECRARSPASELTSVQECHNYELVPLGQPGGSTIEINYDHHEAYRFGPDLLRCNQPNGYDNMWPRQNVETSVAPPTRTKCFAPGYGGIVENITESAEIQCWHKFARHDWRPAAWRYHMVYKKVANFTACTSTECQLARCGATNATELGSGVSHYAVGAGDDPEAFMASPLCEGIKPAMHAKCDAEKAALRDACLAGGEWRTALPPKTLDDVLPTASDQVEFCSASYCTSYGNDCCAPYGEPQTCQGGFTPKRTGDECYGDPEGMYTCCTGTAGPSPPPLSSGLYPYGWMQPPFSLSYTYQPGHSLPFLAVYDECVPPLCFSFNASSGGTQPTTTDANGATVADCELDSGLASHVSALQGLHPCKVEATPAAAPSELCAEAASYLAPAHLKMAGAGGLRSFIDADLLGECTVGEMLPGACEHSSPFVESKCTLRLYENCDGGAAAECAPALCPELGYFLTPNYDTSFGSLAEVEQLYAERQRMIRGDEEPPMMPEGPAGKVGRWPRSLSMDHWSNTRTEWSQELEKLFPSLAIEFAGLNTAKMQGTLRLATAYEPTQFHYVRAPEEWRAFDNGTMRYNNVDGAGDDPWRMSQQAWRPLLGRLMLLPTLQMWWSNALLRSSLESTPAAHNASLSVGFKSFPEYARRGGASMEMMALSQLLAGLNVLFVPLATSFLLPLMASVLVAEKQARTRALMTMMGMKMKYYWLAEWLWNTVLTTANTLVFLIVCGISQQSFLVRSPVIMILLLLLWSQCLIAMANLSACIYRSVLASTIGSYFMLMVVFLVGSTLNQLAFQATGDFPIALGLFAPFTYSRALYLVLRSTYTIDTLSPELGAMFGMLAVDTVLYHFLALYLDAVLPKDLGVGLTGRCSGSCAGGGREHPLFFLAPLKRCACALLGGTKVLELGMGYCTRYDVDLVEDDDVRAEREMVEALERRPETSSSSSTRAQNSEHLIVSSSLRKQYSGGKVAVRNLSMTVRRGECFGFLGPNGAGKTTAISVWTGLYEPSAGSATICGFDIKTQLAKVYGLIGVCPQFDILWPLLTVREHLRFYAQLKGLPKWAWDAEAARAAASVELSHAETRPVGRLSGGMKRRVSFAISLIAAPEVVFLDEPTTGLDPETKRHMWSLVDAAKPGRSIVLTTHSMEEADALSDRLGIMAYGALRCIGTSLHLKAKFGAGHKIDLVMREGSKEAAKKFVHELLLAKGTEDGTVLAGESETQLTIQMKQSAVKLSELFTAMDGRPAEVGIVQWALRQTSMEEVFLRIARESEADQAHRLEAKQGEKDDKSPCPPWGTQRV